MKYSEIETEIASLVDSLTEEQFVEEFSEEFISFYENSSTHYGDLTRAKLSLRKTFLHFGIVIPLSKIGMTDQESPRRFFSTEAFLPVKVGLYWNEDSDRDREFLFLNITELGMSMVSEHHNFALLSASAIYHFLKEIQRYCKDIAFISLEDKGQEGPSVEDKAREGAQVALKESSLRFLRKWNIASPLADLTSLSISTGIDTSRVGIKPFDFDKEILDKVKVSHYAESHLLWSLEVKDSAEKGLYAKEFARAKENFDLLYQQLGVELKERISELDKHKRKYLYPGYSTHYTQGRAYHFYYPNVLNPSDSLDDVLKSFSKSYPNIDIPYSREEEITPSSVWVSTGPLF